jgi:hypothetical protein
MREKLEQDAVNFIMGPAYMEDTVRMETNRMGFCAAHIQRLYAEQNRLGLGLMLHTFMQRLNKDMASKLREIPLPRFGKNKGTQPHARLNGHLKTVRDSCYLCQMTGNTFERYMGTFLYLWSRGGEETVVIEAVPGYCLPHFIDLLDAAENELSKNKRDRFLAKAIPAQQIYMKQMEDDLEWFTLKFDYRNADEPWKNSKDALPRALAMLRKVKTEG